MSDDEGEVSDRVREGGVSVSEKGKCGGCLDVPSFFFLVLTFPRSFFSRDLPERHMLGV